MTIRQALNLHEDADILLAYVLFPPPSSPSRASGEGEVRRGWLYANQANKLTTKQSNKFKSLIKKRLNHWPLAYLIGHKEFFGLNFKVTPDVLIPRPETELLVELALELLLPSPNSSHQGKGIPLPLRERSALRLPARSAGRSKGRVRGYQIIDVGTGSGNIIISIAKKLAEYGRLLYQTPRYYAIDSSTKALQIGKENARRHGVLNEIKFLQGNLLDPLLHLPLKRGRKSGGLSIVVANLPYLTKKQLQQPTIKHEPKRALYGGPDGLKYFRELFKQISPITYNQKPITLILEHDPAQKPKLKKLARQYFPLAKIKFHKDLAGRFRILEIQI